MKTTNPYRFVSKDQRERGGVGFTTDNRTHYEDTPDPFRLRKGQKLDFFEVGEECAHCGQVAPLNIVSLCGSCAQTVALGDRRNHGGNGDPALMVLERAHRRGLSALATIKAAAATMDEEEGAAFLRKVAHRIR